MCHEVRECKLQQVSSSGCVKPPHFSKPPHLLKTPHFSKPPTSQNPPLRLPRGPQGRGPHSTTPRGDGFCGKDVDYLEYPRGGGLIPPHSIHPYIALARPKQGGFCLRLYGGSTGKSPYKQTRSHIIMEEHATVYIPSFGLCSPMVQITGLYAM